MDILIFYAISTLLILMSIAIALSRRLMHSLIFLFFFVVLVSSMFILLAFPFLGVAELIIYNGGIVVLLTVAASLIPEERLGFDRKKILIALPILMIALMLILPFGQASTTGVGQTNQPSLGIYLFSHYSLLILVAAVTLLASLMTAVYFIRSVEGE